MIEALLVMAGIALVLGALLGFSAVRFRVEGDPIVDRVDALLPQTQCGQCGYAGCRPYAEAVAAGKADINRCAPGGEAGVRRLAELMGVEPKPLDEAVAAEAKPKSVAVIDEHSCIGCTLCIQACPVDAIVGAAKQMHTVVAAQCTGCELCIEPCPVDCIEMRPLAEGPAGWRWQPPSDALRKAA